MTVAISTTIVVSFSREMVLPKDGADFGASFAIALDDESGTVGERVLEGLFARAHWDAGLERDGELGCGGARPQAGVFVGVHHNRAG